MVMVAMCQWDLHEIWFPIVIVMSKTNWNACVQTDRHTAASRCMRTLPCSLALRRNTSILRNRTGRMAAAWGRMLCSEKHPWRAARMNYVSNRVAKGVCSGSVDRQRSPSPCLCEVQQRRDS